jgi:glucose-1-phosphate thymidylyltransferase long form
MLAVILGAGEGTRMRPLTYTRPKVMLPVLGIPIIEHIVNSCVEARIKHVIIVTGYKEESIRSHFHEAQHGAQIEFVTQEKQRGTADAIGQVRDLVDERFLALNGDSLVNPLTLKSLAETQKDSAVVIAAKRVKEPTNYGIIDVVGHAVLKITEKPGKPVSDLANLGIYAFNPMIFDAIAQIPKSARGEYEITDAIQLVIDQGDKVRYLDVREQWIDIGRPWDLL